MKLRALFASLVSVTAIACDPVGTVRGTVTEAPSKTPVSGATVALRCGEGGAGASTDAQGKYETRRVGFLYEACVLEATKDGYEPSKTKVLDKCTDADKEHCRNAQIDVELTPKK
jgi:hypothetical protein